MNLERYPVVPAPDFKRFEFFSVGPNGTIKKVVLYQRFDYKIFNLAFGDWDEELQKMDTTKWSNNNDRDKVLATVASTVLQFFEHNPGMIIWTEGTIPANTRLYQMKINKNSGEIGERFWIQGYFNGTLEDMVAGKNYEGFVLWEK
jgi:hypothetical protein